MISLRAFCVRSMAGIAFLAATPWAVAGRATRRRSVSLDELSYGKFAAELGSLFHVRANERRVLALRLIRAEWSQLALRAKPSAPDAAFEKFSLVFAGSRAHQLAQETYAFEHPRLGRFEMFIVPVPSLDPAVHKYEAVFNRPAAT